ncbi:hypothetical protein PUN4_460017 [Paraburkholderia unamae]|uniref:hypothetical protein n=1 Tax=Paraburkholderia unamae TaxID=219649 RepID=UPI001CB57401|nr:hypothetical protein [Paraburkholderia unamae]CAG9264426.1 hypothetical protein PUN4_460017 [Paraburkholderia unamae]
MGQKSPRGSRAQQCPPPYYSIPCALDFCDEVRALSAHAYRLLHQIAALHHGFDNGHIAFTRATAHALGWTSNRVFDRALSDLLNSGLLFQTRLGAGRQPRLFALAWLPVTKVGGLALIPDTVLMPEMASVQVALKKLKSSQTPETWSLQTGAFVASPWGHEKKHAAHLRGHKTEPAAHLWGGGNQLSPTRGATNTALSPTCGATIAAHVSRYVMGVDAQHTDTTEPDLPASKNGGRA